jgi:hypothetical protein
MMLNRLGRSACAQATLSGIYWWKVPMHPFRNFLVGVTMSLLGVAAAAFTYGGTTTYGGLTWAVSTPISGMAACTQLYLNASSDFVNTNSFAVFGAYNCPALGGGYAATGVGYFGTDGAFNLTVNFGAGWQIGCARINASTMSGSCSVYDSAGTYRGAANVNFQ